MVEVDFCSWVKKDFDVALASSVSLQKQKKDTYVLFSIIRKIYWSWTQYNFNSLTGKWVLGPTKKGML